MLQLQPCTYLQEQFRVSGPSPIISFVLVAVVAALADVSEVVEQLQGSLIKMENFQKLLELKKDLTGIDNLVVPGRVS